MMPTTTTLWSAVGNPTHLRSRCRGGIAPGIGSVKDQEAELAPELWISEIASYRAAHFLASLCPPLRPWAHMEAGLGRLHSPLRADVVAAPRRPGAPDWHGTTPRVYAFKSVPRCVLHAALPCAPLFRPSPARLGASQARPLRRRRRVGRPRAPAENVTTPACDRPRGHK